MAYLFYDLFTAVQTFAVTVTVTPPTAPGNQADADEAARKLGIDISNKVNKYKPKNFAKANTDSASHVNHAATQRGYTGYEYFAVTLGVMMGFQTSSSLPSYSTYSDLKNLHESIENKGDAEIGFSNLFALQLGLKAWFISDDLYLGAKIGRSSIELKPGMRNSFKYDAFMCGLTANYLFLNGMPVKGEGIKWKGLNFGTGFIYQTSDTKYASDPYYVVGGGSGDSGAISLLTDPKTFRFDIDSSIVTIPLELMTALRLYSLNLTLGVGADLTMGKTDITLDVDRNVKVVSGGDKVTKPGRVNVKGNDASPKLINPKLIGGIGIYMGVVIIDMPFTIYAGNGFDIGVTAGVVW